MKYLKTFESFNSCISCDQECVECGYGTEECCCDDKTGKFYDDNPDEGDLIEEE